MSTWQNPGAPALLNPLEPLALWDALGESISLYLGSSHWVNKEAEEVPAVLEHMANGDLFILNPSTPSCSPSSFMDDVSRKRKTKAKSQPGVIHVGAQLCPVLPFLSGETLRVGTSSPALSWGR